MEDTRRIKPSHEMLYIIAGIIWGIGAWACADQAMILIRSVSVTFPVNSVETIATLSTSAFVGMLLAYFFFAPLAVRNIRRLEQLKYPRWYQSYRLRFYLMLCVFDGGVILLTTLFAKDSISKLVMGGVDLTIAFSLGLSIVEYLLQWHMFRKNIGNHQSVFENDANIQTAKIRLLQEQEYTAMNV